MIKIALIEGVVSYVRDEVNAFIKENPDITIKNIELSCASSAYVVVMVIYE